MKETKYVIQAQSAQSPSDTFIKFMVFDEKETAVRKLRELIEKPEVGRTLHDYHKVRIVRKVTTKDIITSPLYLEQERNRPKKDVVS